MSLLSLQNCHKHYNGTPILQGVDINTNSGEITTLIGHSGSGKSTLLRCLNLLEVPDQGTLTFEDKHFNFLNGTCTNLQNTQYKHTLRALRQDIGMVFQNYNLWPHMTILENIIQAPQRVLGKTKSEATDHAMALLKQVDLSLHADKYPHALSGGQQQRVAIARALAMSPKVLLLDEPTAALDPIIAAGILDILKGLKANGMTLLMVTHAIHFIEKFSDNVLFIHEGKVLEQGPPATLFNTPQTDPLKLFLDAVHAY